MIIIITLSPHYTVHACKNQIRMLRLSLGSVASVTEHLEGMLRPAPRCGEMAKTFTSVVEYSDKSSSSS